MNGLEPDQLLDLLVQDLTPWMAEMKGTLSVASDPWNFLDLLSQSPSGWRGVLHFEGDDNRQEHVDEGCFLNYRFSFGITAQKGLTVRPEERLYKSTAEIPAITRLLAAARLRIRSLAFPADVSQRLVKYTGCSPAILPDGTPLLGYVLRFELIAHPEPVTAYRNL